MTGKGIGAIILAAGKSDYMKELKPMLKVGQTTMIQKEIDTLRQAGITPIVVVTGYQAEDLERHIAHRGAVCVRNKKYETSQMLDSIRLGLRYVRKKVERVLLFPSDIPLVSPGTIAKIIEKDARIAIPVFQGQKGHPVMLEKSVFPFIMEYQGERGLRGAMEECGVEAALVELEDRGVVLDTNTEQDYEALLKYEKDNRSQVGLTYQIAVSLHKAQECFGEETAGFLEAIDETGSMLGACQAREISYSKGWKLIKRAEEQLGIVFLTRQTGGSKGGSSSLTEAGKEFLNRYRNMERLIHEFAEKAFAEVFG